MRQARVLNLYLWHCVQDELVRDGLVQDVRVRNGSKRDVRVLKVFVRNVHKQDVRFQDVSEWFVCVQYVRVLDANVREMSL